MKATSLDYCRYFLERFTHQFKPVNLKPSIQMCRFKSVNPNPSIQIRQCTQFRLFLNFFTIISRLYWDCFGTFWDYFGTFFGSFRGFFATIVRLSCDHFRTFVGLLCKHFRIKMTPKNTQNDSKEVSK